MNPTYGCCCPGPGEGDCTECPTTGNCATRLGYSSVVFESTLTFDYGFDHPCSCSNNPVRHYDGSAALDAANDIGVLTLYAPTNAPCFLRRAEGAAGNQAWTPPTIATATDVCNTPAGANIALKPVREIKVYCKVFVGVAYGVCELAIYHAGGSGFGSGYSYIRYRKIMASDCKIPLGDYDHYETQFYSTCVDGPNCDRACVVEQEAIWNIVPGKVTLS
jgi:hypothetical protein